MNNAKLCGVVYHACGAQTDCALDSPMVQSIRIDWDTGDALMNEDRLGYTDPTYAMAQWEKTMAAARLMAAAPNLLEAATHALEDLNAIAEGRATVDDVSGVLVELRNAISLATPSNPNNK